MKFTNKFEMNEIKSEIKKEIDKNKKELLNEEEKMDIVIEENIKELIEKNKKRIIRIKKII